MVIGLFMFKILIFGIFKYTQTSKTTNADICSFYIPFNNDECPVTAHTSENDHILL